MLEEMSAMAGNPGAPQGARSAVSNRVGADSLRALQVLSLLAVSEINQLLQARLRRTGGG